MPDSQSDNDNGPMCHLALFRLARQAGSHSEALSESLRNFATAVPRSRDAVVESDAGLRLGHPRAFDTLLALTFDDRAAVREYLASAAHERFVRDEVLPRCDAIASIQVPAFVLPRPTHAIHKEGA